MQTYYGNSGIQPGAGNRNHRELLAELKQARKEYETYATVMTPYERELVSRDIQRKREAYHDTVVQGVLDEFNTALDNLKAAQARKVAAAEKEAQRWDSGKLSTELSTARQLVELAKQRGDESAFGGLSVQAKLAGILQDAQLSKDIHKLRAVCEVIASQPGTVAGTLPGAVNQLLRHVRDIPEIAEAQQAEYDALVVMDDARTLLTEAGAAIGEDVDGIMPHPGPLIKAARRVKATPQGVVILDENDVEVTGVVIHAEGGPND